MIWKALSLLAALPALTAAASLELVTDTITPNPTNVSFYIYVPDKLAARPPILVTPHWCHGDAIAAYNGSQYPTWADQYGFIVIYPDSPNTVDKCWDVSSNGTLRHNAGGDSLGIVSMVRHTLKKYHGDPSRVFSVGISSGAMMTNVLIGAYPDVFAAGTAFAGVAFGCFHDPAGGFDVWSNDCATGQITHTQAEWAAIVRAGYPGYKGWRPKMQVYHGTVDNVLNYTNFFQEIAEWTGVFGFSDKPRATVQNTPVSGYTKMVYGPSTGKDTDGSPAGWFEAFSIFNGTHNIGDQEPSVIGWFDLNCTRTDGSCYKHGDGLGWSRPVML